jgi:hypothetical protein
VRIICANGRMDATFHVWVGKLSFWGDVDYVANMTRGVGADPSSLRSLHLYHEDFTDLVIAEKGVEE